MQSFREAYFTPAQFKEEVSRIKSEIDSFGARKREWMAEISESALVVADLQNYFLLPESHAYVPSSEAILPNIRRMIEFFRERKRPVIFTRHIDVPGNAGSMDWWWAGLVEETSDLSVIFGGLNIKDDIVLVKHQYDAFLGTSLEEILNSACVRYLVVCGVMTNLCCETTTRSAFVRGFRPVLPVDATAAYNREFHLATFRNLAFGFAPVMTTEEVVRTLQS